MPPINPAALANPPLATPLVVTMGDPAGIGGDIALSAWRKRAALALPAFVMIDDPARLARLAHELGWTVPIRVVSTAAEAVAVFSHSLPVLALSLPAPVVWGQPDGRNAAMTIAAIDQAVALVQTGEAAAMVTNPIAKSVLYETGFRHPGHTEYLAHLAGLSTPPIMLLACEALRVVPVTVHLSLREATAALSTEAIIHAGRVTAEALWRRFGIPHPHLAVAALNPHAGESGALGREELDIIAPAIAQLQADGISAFGPAPVDTLFHPEARAGYDACLCMVHDHALIPLKTLDFYGGVNVTLGLPFVRTSPDHGTAFGIAGQGVARDDSFCQSLRLAQQMTQQMTQPISQRVVLAHG